MRGRDACPAVTWQTGLSSGCVVLQTHTHTHTLGHRMTSLTHKPALWLVIDCMSDRLLQSALSWEWWWSLIAMGWWCSTVRPGDSVLCGLTLSITDLWRSVFPVLHVWKKGESGVNISRFWTCNWPTELEGRTEALLYGLGASPSLPPSRHPNPPICYFLLLPPLIFHSSCLLPPPLHVDTLNWSATTTRCCDWLPPRRWVSQAAQQHGSWCCWPLMHNSTPLMLLLLI